MYQALEIIYKISYALDPNKPFIYLGMRPHLYRPFVYDSYQSSLAQSLSSHTLLLWQR